MATTGYTTSANWTDVSVTDVRGAVNYVSGYEILPSTGTKYYRVVMETKWPYTTTDGSSSATRASQTIFPIDNYNIIQATWPEATTTTTTTTTTTAAPAVSLSTPYGAVTGSGTVSSKWVWQSGSGFSVGTSAKLLTAVSSVTLRATLTQTGGGNCDAGESLSLGIYSAANARIRTMSSGAESLTAGQYIQMELDCAHGRAEVWIV